MMRMCADGTGPGKSIVSPNIDNMAIDDDENDEQEIEDDEVHMTDVTPTPHNTKFVIDDDEEDYSEEETERVGSTKQQQRKESTITNEALAYGQQLYEDYRDDPRDEVRRILADAFSLLAYSDPRRSVMGHLLEESGRREVAEELNSAILGTSPPQPIQISRISNRYRVDRQESDCAIGIGNSPCIKPRERTRRERQHECLCHQC